jgi:hypothetical protein
MNPHEKFLELKRAKMAAAEAQRPAAVEEQFSASGPILPVGAVREGEMPSFTISGSPAPKAKVAPRKKLPPKKAKK